MKKRAIFPKLYIVLILLLMYFPIAPVVLYSFNAARINVWSGFSLEWYVRMMNNGALLSALWVSVKVAVISAAAAAVIGTLGAVGLNKLNKTLKLAVTGLSYIPLVIPEIVLGVAMLMFFAAMPVQFGITTLALSHTAICVPYILFMTLVRLNGIDPSINEAARDLGASRTQLFFTVTLPLITPAVVSGTLLAVAMSLDDVVISMFLSGPGSTTLPVKIYSMIKLGVTPEINALCTLLLLFTFITIGAITIIDGNSRKQKGEI